MTQTLLTISEADLARIEAALAALATRLDRVEMRPKPEWLTLDEYAARIGRSKRTVQRYIDAGRLDTKSECGVVMIRAPR